jgi:hypothetical protein
MPAFGHDKDGLAGLTVKGTGAVRAGVDIEHAATRMNRRVVTAERGLPTVAERSQPGFCLVPKAVPIQVRVG